MTFYQELQLNQAGSKNLLKKSETVKEKSYHILVYFAAALPAARGTLKEETPCLPLLCAA